MTFEETTQNKQTKQQKSNTKQVCCGYVRLVEGRKQDNKQLGEEI